MRSNVGKKIGQPFNAAIEIHIQGNLRVAAAGLNRADVGAANLNGRALNAGDAAALQSETQLRLAQGLGAEVLVFDLAP